MINPEQNEARVAAMEEYVTAICEASEEPIRIYQWKPELENPAIIVFFEKKNLHSMFLWSDLKPLCLEQRKVQP